MAGTVEVYNSNGAGNGNVTAVSANYSATAANYLILATGGAGGITVTLPTATGSGRIIVVKKADSGLGAVTVNASTNGGTIDGSNTASLTTQYWTITVIDSATNLWSVLSEVGISSPI